MVWIDMLDGDNANMASGSARHVDNARIRHFHDPGQIAGKAIADSLGAQNHIAWDMYLFYVRGKVWKEKIPFPFDWAHQLSDPWAGPEHFAWREGLDKRLNSIISRLIKD